MKSNYISRLNQPDRAFNFHRQLCLLLEPSGEPSPEWHIWSTSEIFLSTTLSLKNKLPVFTIHILFQMITFWYKLKMTIIFLQKDNLAIKHPARKFLIGKFLYQDCMQETELFWKSMVLKKAPLAVCFLDASFKLSEFW